MDFIFKKITYIDFSTCKRAVLWPAAAAAHPHKETCLHTPPADHQLPAETEAQSAEEEKHRQEQ